MIAPFTLFIPAYTRRDMSVVAFIAFDFYPVHPIILKILIQTVFCLCRFIGVHRWLHFGGVGAGFVDELA